MKLGKVKIQYQRGDLWRLIVACSAGCFSLLTTRYGSTIEDRLVMILAFCVSLVGVFCIDRRSGFSDFRTMPSTVCRTLAAVVALVLVYLFQGYQHDGDYTNWFPMSLLGKVVLVGIAVGSVPFAFVGCSRFFEWCRRRLKKLWQEQPRDEKIVFFVVSVFAIVSSTLISCFTTAFTDPAIDSFTNPQGTHQVWFDVIFTSDSGHLLNRGAFLNFSCVQNDIRQPFFALLALPFSLAALPFSPIPCGFATVLVAEQILCVYLVSCILSSLLKLERIEKYLFRLLFCVAFGNFLFAFLLEQYAFAVFYLALAVEAAVEKRDAPARALTAAAAGGLATSILFAPMATTCYQRGKSFGQAIKSLVIECLQIAGWFFLALAVTGQLTQLAPHRLLAAVSDLGQFTGESVSRTEIFYQYTWFVRNLFFAPETQILTWAEAWGVEGIPSIQLMPATSASVMGILLFVLAVAAYVVCRKERFATVCAYWILVSLVILAGLGWGAAENGMVLYSMYFAWAFLGLYASAFYKLVKNQYVRVGVTAAFALFFLVWNGIALAQIVSFGVTYYPA